MSNDEKPSPTQHVGLRLGRGLVAEIDALAEKEERTRNKMVAMLLRDAVERRRKVLA